MVTVMRSMVWLALAASGCSLHCGAGASASMGFRAGLETPFVVRGSDGTAMLGLVIEPSARVVRRPVSIVLVVDTSGSMEGHSIEHARAAAGSIVEALVDGDEAGLVAFDSTPKVGLRLSPLLRNSAEFSSHRPYGLPPCRLAQGPL